MRLTLKSKLIAAFAVVLSLLVGLSWVSISRLSESNTALAHIIENEAEGVRLANELEQNFLILSDLVNSHIMASTQEDMAELETEIEAIQTKNLATIEQLLKLSDEDGKRIMAEVNAARTALIGVTEAITEQSRLVSNERATALSFGAGHEATAEMQQLLDTLETSIRTSGVPEADRALTLLATLKANLFEAILAERNAIILTDDAKIATERRRAEGRHAAILQGLDALDSALGGIGRADRAQLREAFDTFRTATIQALDLAAINSGTRAQETQHRDAAADRNSGVALAGYGQREA